MLGLGFLGLFVPICLGIPVFLSKKMELAMLVREIFTLFFKISILNL